MTKYIKAVWHWFFPVHTVEQPVAEQVEPSPQQDDDEQSSQQTVSHVSLIDDTPQDDIDYLEYQISRNDKRKSDKEKKKKEKYKNSHKK